MSGIIFIIVGRFGKTLTTSKVLPIIASKKFKRIYIFREEAGHEIPGCEYITLSFLKNIKNQVLRKIIRYLAEPLQIIYFSLKYKPDFINGYQMIPKGIYSYIAARISGTKCIISLVGGIPEIETYLKPKGLWKKITLLILRNTDIITTKGEVSNNFLKQNSVDPKILFIFNGAIDTSLYKLPGKKDRETDILFVGNFSELKGPDRVLSVIKKLKYHLPNIKAIFLGDGVLYDSILSEVENNNLHENVRLLGYVDRTVEYFQDSKLLLMPSISEGLPTAMLEAMACGCVPVVSDVGNILEAAISGHNSILVSDYQDVSSFYKESLELLQSENKRAKLAQAGYQLIQEKYTVYAQKQIFTKIVSSHFNKE